MRKKNKLEDDLVELFIEDEDNKELSMIEEDYKENFLSLTNNLTTEPY